MTCLTSSVLLKTPRLSQIWSKRKSAHLKDFWMIVISSNRALIRLDFFSNYDVQDCKVITYVMIFKCYPLKSGVERNCNYPINFGFKNECENTCNIWFKSVKYCFSHNTWKKIVHTRHEFQSCPFFIWESINKVSVTWKMSN